MARSTRMSLAAAAGAEPPSVKVGPPVALLAALPDRVRDALVHARELRRERVARPRAGRGRVSGRTRASRSRGNQTSTHACASWSVTVQTPSSNLPLVKPAATRAGIPSQRSISAIAPA